MTKSMIDLIFFMSIGSPFVAAWNVLMYLIPWFMKSWTSRKILAFELFFDTVFMVLWTCSFIAAAYYIAPVCAPGMSLSGNGVCTQNNWVVAFAFFESVAWITSFVLDIISFYKGVIAKPDVDPEALLEIRRSARGRF